LFFLLSIIIIIVQPYDGPLHCPKYMGSKVFYSNAYGSVVTFIWKIQLLSCYLGAASCMAIVTSFYQRSCFLSQ